MPPECENCIFFQLDWILFNILIVMHFKNHVNKSYCDQLLFNKIMKNYVLSFSNFQWNFVDAKKVDFPFIFITKYYHISSINMLHPLHECRLHRKSVPCSAPSLCLFLCVSKIQKAFQYENLQLTLNKASHLVNLDKLIRVRSMAHYAG